MAKGHGQSDHETATVLYHAWHKSYANAIIEHSCLGFHRHTYRSELLIFFSQVETPEEYWRNRQMKMLNVGGYDFENPDHKINKLPKSPEMKAAAEGQE